MRGRTGSRRRPVHRGEPGYGPHLDRDGDGVGCE
ncbi:excalibur calcium-binding domain-containing protein [Streptomyces sp. NPDC048337]